MLGSRLTTLARGSGQARLLEILLLTWSRPLEPEGSFSFIVFVLIELLPSIFVLMVAARSVLSYNLEPFLRCLVLIAIGCSTLAFEIASALISVALKMILLDNLDLLFLFSFVLAGLVFSGPLWTGEHSSSGNWEYLLAVAIEVEFTLIFLRFALKMNFHEDFFYASLVVVMPNCSSDPEY